MERAEKDMKTEYDVEGSKMHLMAPSIDRVSRRSETPMGFAQAFYEVNR